MSNDLTMTKVTACKSSKQWEIDGLIKLIQAVLLAIVPFLLHKPISFILLFVYLLCVSLISGIKSRTLLTSLVSYCLVFLIPYLFGLMLNSLLYLITDNKLLVDLQGTDEIFLRLIRLFIIWYISILYFNTTPIQTVAGLLDKVLQPIKLIGVPVSDFLKIVMYIVMDLTVSGAEIKESLGEKIRAMAGSSDRKFNINIKTISQIIVSLIMSSFDRLDKLESLLKEDHVGIEPYRFKLSKDDVISILSFMVLISLMLLIERGYLF